MGLSDKELIDLHSGNYLPSREKSNCRWQTTHLQLVFSYLINFDFWA